jgi:aspartate-semialdehyde dehydrogenase
MSSTGLEIAVIGATGAAGEQVLAALEGSDLPIGSLHAYGSTSRSGRVDSVTFRGETIGVEPATALASAKPDLAILCVAPAVAGKLAPGLVSRGVFVLDVGDATAGVLDAPLVAPGIQAALPEGSAQAGAVRIPSAAGWFVAQLCAPLVPIGLRGCSGVLSLSASSHGKAGMEELAQQVVATLNNQDPARRVFVDGLAFDTLPEDVPSDEWSAAEQLLAVEVAALAGLPAEAVAVQVATQPLFAGVSAGLHLRGVTLDAVEAAWQDAPELHAMTRTARLRPRAVTGKGGVWWGRLRADPGGDGVHVWAVADNLHVAGVAAAQVASWLRAAGLLGVA